MARARRPRQQIPADERHLLDLMELPESHLSAAELDALDKYIAAKTAAIRAQWTPEQEAAARGVKFRPHRDRHFEFDGRVYQSLPVRMVDSREAEDRLFESELRGI